MAEKFEPTEEVVAVVKEKLVPLVSDVRSLFSAAQSLASELKSEGIECKASDLTQLAYRIHKERR